MKNRIMFILTFAATVGLIGNAFAVQPNSWAKNNGYTGTPVKSVDIPENPVPIKVNGKWVYSITSYTSENTTPIGMASSKKDIGGLNQDNIGVVTSLNPRNNVAVIENKHCPKTSIVSTDDQTFASLQVGQVVSAKMNNMYGNRAEIVGFGR